MTLRHARGAIGQFTMPSVSDLIIQYEGELTLFSIAKHFPRLERLTIQAHDFLAINERLPHLTHFAYYDRSCGHSPN